MSKYIIKPLPGLLGRIQRFKEESLLELRKTADAVSRGSASGVRRHSDAHLAASMELKRIILLERTFASVQEQFLPKNQMVGFDMDALPCY